MGSWLPGKAIETLWPEEVRVSVFITEELVEIPREGEIHRAFELACVTRGGQVRYLPGCHTLLEPGDVCLVPPWEPHSWRITEPHTSCVSVHFLPQFLGAEMIGNTSWLTLFACPADKRPRTVGAAMRKEILTFVEFLSRGTPTYTWYERRRLQRPRGSGETLVQVVNQMVPGGKDLPPAWEDGIRYDLLRILITLYRGWEPSTTPKRLAAARADDLSTIMPAVRLTMRGLSAVERIPLEEAAAACSLSVTHFRRIFRRTMGTTFGQFEVRQRLAEAERLLHTTNLNLESVAERCCFSDASHLNRLFKRFYGHTAAQHRKRIPDLVRGTRGSEGVVG